MQIETSNTIDSQPATETPTEVVIREAIPSDKDDLVRLIMRFNIDSESTMPEMQFKMREYKDVEAAARERSERYLTDPKYSVFVAEHDGGIRGYISGTIYDRPERVYGKEGYLENWVVDEEYQSKGVGKRLYARLMEVFADADCSHVTVGTHVQNDRAIKIYEHLGFLPRLVILSKPLKKLLL